LIQRLNNELVSTTLSHERNRDRSGSCLVGAAVALLRQLALTVAALSDGYKQLISVSGRAVVPHAAN